MLFNDPLITPYTTSQILQRFWVRHWWWGRKSLWMFLLVSLLLVLFLYQCMFLMYIFCLNNKCFAELVCNLKIKQWAKKDKSIYEVTGWKEKNRQCSIFGNILERENTPIPRCIFNGSCHRKRTLNLVMRSP